MVMRAECMDLDEEGALGKAYPGVWGGRLRKLVDGDAAGSGGSGLASSNSSISSIGLVGVFGVGGVWVPLDVVYRASLGMGLENEDNLETGRGAVSDAAAEVGIRLEK